MAFQLNLILRTVLGRKLDNTEVDSNFNQLGVACNDLQDQIDALGQASDPSGAINAAITAHKADADAHTQYLKPPSSTNDGLLYAMRNGLWTQFTPGGDNSGGALEFAVRTYTAAYTSGTYTAEEIINNVVPTADSTAVNLGLRITSNYNSNFQETTGGSHGGLQIVTNTAGEGYVDKSVGILSHINWAGGGRRGASLAFECGILSIAAGARPINVAGFYFPNALSIPNIDRIRSLFAFANQYKYAAIQNMGVYLDSELRQVVPPNHPGWVKGRYYTGAYAALTAQAMTAGRWDFMPLYVPERTNIAELGLTVGGTAVASSKARIGMFTSVRGVPVLLKGQTAELDCSTTGNKVAVVNFDVEAGFYWLGVMASAGITINYHQMSSVDEWASKLGLSDPTQQSSASNMPYLAYMAPGTYPATGFPASLASALTYAPTPVHPHLWARCGDPARTFNGTVAWSDTPA